MRRERMRRKQRGNTDLRDKSFTNVDFPRPGYPVIKTRDHMHETMDADTRTHLY